MGTDYSIVDKDGETIEIGLTKQQAIRIARQRRVEGKPVIIHFYRVSDGQIGYLNPGPTHDITGKYWE